MLDKVLKNFPKDQTLQSTIATVVSYKASKWFSSKIAAWATAKNDPASDKVDPNLILDPEKLQAKKSLYELIGSVVATFGSIYGYKKIKNRNYAYGVVIGTGLNTVDKFFSLPKVKESIPKTMQPLFAGEENQSTGNISTADYERQLGDARFTANEEDVKALLNIAKMNGYLDGFGGEMGSDAIVITPEERAALLESSQMNGEEMGAYDPNYLEYEYPSNFAGEEDELDGEEEFA